MRHGFITGQLQNQIDRENHFIRFNPLVFIIRLEKTKKKS